MSELSGARKSLTLSTMPPMKPSPSVPFSLLLEAGDVLLGVGQLRSKFGEPRAKLAVGRRPGPDHLGGERAHLGGGGADRGLRLGEARLHLAGVGAEGEIDVGRHGRSQISLRTAKSGAGALSPAPWHLACPRRSLAIPAAFSGQHGLASRLGGALRLDAEVGLHHQLDRRMLDPVAAQHLVVLEVHRVDVGEAVAGVDGEVAVDAVEVQAVAGAAFCFPTVTNPARLITVAAAAFNSAMSVSN